MKYLLLFLTGLVTVLSFPKVQEVKTENIEQQAREFINNVEKELQKSQTKLTFDEWNYATNITEETQKISAKSEEEHSKLNKKFGKEAQKFDLNFIKDYDVARKLKMLRNIGTSALPDDKLGKFIDLTSKMGSTYSKGKVLDYETKTKEFSLDPELSETMRKSRDPEELKYYWEQWREVSGKQIKEMYSEYVDMYNEAAKLNGFKDASIMKVDPYESDTFIEEMEETWQGLKPLYEELHAYVRNKLNKFYGDDIVPNNGQIPAHLLGNMWAQSWGNIGDLVRPFPNKPSIDVSDEMVKKGWTAKLMFEKTDEFFQSMGMLKLPEEFWSGSLIEKPDDGRDLVCHASAWDFYNGKDFRIKQCTKVNQEDFLTVNHEMGHTQYQMQYKNLSHLYRDGANPGFHEGVADILALAAGSASYLQQLGLIDADVDILEKETNINILFDNALDSIAFLPFGYLVDKFRWDVYSGITSKQNMNCHWWKLKSKIQGIKPPSMRNNDQFDAGAKFHVAADVGYVRYFTARIYEFQFYREMCLVSGKYVKGDPTKPLHQCNFFGSKEAGDKLREMEVLGASKPWKEAMTVMTGEPRMNTDALREYFSPLENWLKEENIKNGVKVGWDHDDDEILCKDNEANLDRELFRFILA